ncbi:Glycosyl transferases group 1 [Poseidonocella pacifica]|uniref:Glycosyl transferases group 1 n=1 Tax=Poseidonocella pacifica TaxID=871651 RepID=A0A1I0XT65_9RHOB|nr:glycosyltransferase [Poseidonocella pacifica]SFB04255.1 Glycosyl transferases group 1 [Poseidonocella pacifica]
MGWVHIPGQPFVKVGLYLQDALLAQTMANLEREDVIAAGLADGPCGFALPLSEETLRLVQGNGGVAEVKVIGPRNQKIGVWRVDRADDPSVRPLQTGLSQRQKRLYGDVELLGKLLELPALEAREPLKSSPVQKLLFDRRDFLHPGHELPNEMFAYTEYIRYRDRLDERYQTDSAPEDVAHFYKRYLGVYGAMRGGLRIPLSKAAIDWLNEPIVIPGQTRHLTRVAWAFLMDVAPILKTMNFGASDWYAWVVYWWSVNQAEAIHCEDCLVPDFLIAVLGAVDETRWNGPLAPSEFMVRIHSETPELAGLDLNTEAGKQDLICALMILGLSRPDYLRYIPDAAIEAMLSSETGPSAFATYVAEMGLPVSDLTRQDYANALRHQRFDLDTKQFLTFTAEGHRVEYASLPVIDEAAADQDVPAVQVIGPFAKASGLGQATRLSAEMVEASGLSLNRVNFGLDNPAPEGFSRAEAVSGYQRAQINLFHLNAEAIPLAAAYQPDTFSGAYNIGYFFWELDSPGACHYLGMEMLDEIWVSSEFGVSVFQPHTDKPVVNVGMSFEALPDISRDEARAFLKKTAKLNSEDFVFLATFDSFSFVQRKNPLGVLAAFRDAFPVERNVRLVIKTQNRTRVADPAQIAIWKDVDKILANDDRIVLINETMQYEDLLRLKAGADAYISLHRSEGWGFGMIEAMNLNVPVICTGYSGNMEFCTEETAWLVDYEERLLEQGEYIFVRLGSFWAEPDVASASYQLRALYDDPVERERKAAAAYDFIQSKFSKQAISQRYARRLHEIIGDLDEGIRNAG